MKKQSQITRSDRGFTLVELIIVIAVIGLLAAILIPVFSNVVYKANAKSALSDARNSVENYLTYALEDPSLPRNLVIIVEKANKFYVYGYNTNVGGSLMISTGNAFTAQSKQDLIDRYSWNSLRTEDYDPNVDEATLASYDIEHYGAFYLVPYSGGEAQNANVRGITRSADDFRCVSDELAQNGANMAIYHGCIVGNNYTYNTDGNSGNANSNNQGGNGNNGGNNNETPTTHTVSFNFTGIEEADKTNVVLKKGSEVLTNPASIPDGTYVNELTAEYPHNESTDEYWYTVGTATADSPVIHGDTTVTFNFTKVNIYTLSFVMGSGETFVPASGASATMRLREGDDIASIVRDSSATTETAGYTFRYWTEQGSAENFAPGTGALTMPARNVTLVPYFSLQNISVTYKAGDHATGDDYDDSVTYGTHALPSFNDIATTAGWTKDANYDFYRWYDGSNEYQAGANYTFTSTTTLTARYTQLQYTVTINQPAGVTAVTGSGTYNMSVDSVNFTVTLNSNYYLTGYSVSGLTGTTTLPANATSIDTSAAQPGDDIRITPNVAAKTVNVTFVSDPAGKGTLPANITGYEIKDGDITLTAPTGVAAHYTFTSYTASGTNITASITNSNTKLHLENPTANTSSVTVTAHFTEDAKFSIIYSKNTDDTVTDMPSTQENLYAGEHNLSSATPARDGYTFLGWGATNDATSYITSVTITSSNVTVYAMWEQNVVVSGTYYYGGAYRHADQTLDFNATKLPEVSGNRPLNIIDSLSFSTTLLNGTVVNRTFTATSQVSVVDGTNYIKCTETTNWASYASDTIIILEATAGAHVTGSSALSSIAGGTDKQFILTEDVQITTWVGGGTFASKLDGMGYSVNGMTGTNVPFTTKMQSGTTYSAGIQNFNLTNVNYSFEFPSNNMQPTIGLLSNSIAAQSLIRNCHISGSMVYSLTSATITKYQIGSLVGYANGSTIDNCTSSVDLTCLWGTSQNSYKNNSGIGGLVGYATGLTVTNSRHIGKVISNMYQVGGIVGYTYSACNITNCRQDGFVTGKQEVGGIVGKDNQNATNTPVNITNCSVTGTVSATSTHTSGSISFTDGGQQCGGIIGYAGGSIIDKCWFNGTLLSDGLGSGGIAGFAKCTSSKKVTIRDCWVAGSIATYGGSGCGIAYTDSTNIIINRCIVLANAYCTINGNSQYNFTCQNASLSGDCSYAMRTIKWGVTLSYNNATGEVSVSGGTETAAYTVDSSLGTSVASAAALKTAINSGSGSFSAWSDKSAWNLTGTYPVLADNPGSPA